MFFERIHPVEDFKVNFKSILVRNPTGGKKGDRLIIFSAKSDEGFPTDF
jgi:hypothetical protein